MSERSTQITFNNNTNYLLVLTNSNLNHGVWNGGPINQILPGQTERVIGQNDSNGFGTGDEGSLNYAVIGTGRNGLPELVGYVAIGWDNPFLGSDSYSNSVTPGSNLNITNSGGSGNNAAVTFTLSIQS